VLGEELALIDVTRRQMARILRGLPEDAWERVGVYRHEGQEELRSLRRLLAMITEHIPHHVAFNVEKRCALGIHPGGVPGGGTFRMIPDTHVRRLLRGPGRDSILSIPENP